MEFFEATGLLGTCNTVARILISIRKCYKAKKKIRKLVESMNKVYRFCSATERVSTLENICNRLKRMEVDLEQTIPSSQLRVQVSVIMEVMVPILDACPRTEDLGETKRLLENARQAFGTHVLGPQMKKMVTGQETNESSYNLVMGKMYYKGLSVDMDYHKSAPFFHNAILCGSAEAYVFLGRHYEGGLGMEKDAKKAFKLYMQGAELNDPECLYEAGECYRYGYGVKKDPRRAFQFYTRAADTGHAACLGMAGFCLEKGIGTDVDLVQSAKYYKMAAEAGNEAALCNFGICLLYGSGVERNCKMAVALFQIASKAGSIDALVRLGECYTNGWGVGQDFQQAFRLYKAAADKDNLYALARTGECLLYGEGVVRNEREGFRCISRAAAGGDSFAFQALAGCFRHGIGTELNKRKALESYQLAAKGGEWDANLRLGEIYKSGDGVSRNIKKAIEHFEIYAKYDQNDAHFHLACIYSENGFRNEERAIFHYRFAADLGNSKARQFLGEHVLRSTIPRKLCFTNDELRNTLRKIAKKYSLRSNNLLEHHKSLSITTFDSALHDLAADEIEFSAGRPAALDPQISEARPSKNNSCSTLSILNFSILLLLVLILSICLIWTHIKYTN